MDWPQYVLTLIAALGGGVTVREIVGAAGRARSGTMKSERVRVKSLVTRAQYAEALAQYDRDFRITVQDHAAHCRRIAIECGAGIADLGPWPTPPEPPSRPVDDPETSTI